MYDLTLSASHGMTPTAQLYLNAVAVGSAIPMTEIGTTGEFYANIPSGTAAGEYLVVFNTGTTKLTSGILQWDGTQEVTPGGASAADVWAYGARTLTAGVPTAAQNAAAVRTELATELARVDVATSTRLASAGYTAPDNTSIGAIKAKTDTLVNGPTLAQIEGSTVLAKEATVATRASQASVNAIPTNPMLTTDARLNNLDATISSRSTLTAGELAGVAVDVQTMNGAEVIGDGTAGNPWRGVGVAP
jgi:hypothetical protein